jgi:hypothetical protein
MTTIENQIFLQTYIDIETKVFVKAEKNKKFDELFSDIKTLAKNFNVLDVIEIIDSLLKQNIVIRQPLYKNLIYPILDKAVENKDVSAINALIKLDQQLLSYQAYTKDEKYTSWTLLEKGLSIAPEDLELIQIQFSKTKKYLNYTLHEIPLGVLYGTNGASIEECDELLNEIVIFESICNKLKLDEHELIEECKYYYPAYRSYLSVFKDYKNFADYLDKECDGQK